MKHVALLVQFAFLLAGAGIVFRFLVSGFPFPVTILVFSLFLGGAAVLWLYFLFSIFSAQKWSVGGSAEETATTQSGFGGIFLLSSVVGVLLGSGAVLASAGADAFSRARGVGRLTAGWDTPQEFYPPLIYHLPSRAGGDSNWEYQSRGGSVSRLWGV